MRRVLIVAYYFPPLGGIGSLRVCGFATHLPEYGWDPTVLAPRNGAYYRDPELRFPEDRVVRTPSLELSRAGKRLLRTGGGDVVPAAVGGVRVTLRNVARATLYFPDAQVGWYAPALLTAREALRNQSFDAIFSSSFPITAHLIARRLHRWMRIPWVAEFRDPWSEMLPAGGRTGKRAARLERSIAHDAAGLVMTSPSWASLHARAWNREVTVIPNGHGEYEPPADHPDGEFSLGYLGSYYPATQRLRAVWDAVKRINHSGGPSVDRLRFIGDLHPALRQELRDRGLESLVEATGFLPHDDASRALRRSSVLLVAGPYDARGILRGHLAAKLSEYLATDLPIVYTGDPDCDAADFLRRHPGCHIVGGDDVEGVVRALRVSRGQRIRRDATGLTKRKLTGRLAELLDAACEPRPLSVSPIG